MLEPPQRSLTNVDDISRAGKKPKGPSLNRQPKNIAKNVASSYATIFVTSLTGLVATPLILRLLGTSGYGVFILAVGAIGYVNLLEVGIGTATVTRTAALEGGGDALISKVLSTSLSLFCCVSAVSVFVVVALTVAFPYVFHVPIGYASQARIIVALLGAGQTVTFLASVYNAALIGTGRFYRLSLAGAAISTATTMLQVTILLAIRSLIVLGAVSAVSSCAGLYVSRLQLRRSLPTVDVAIRLRDRRMARTLLTLGWRNAGNYLAGSLAFGSDVIMVGLFLSPPAAAAYALAQKPVSLAQTLAFKVADVVAPAYASSSEHGTDDRTFALYRDSVAICWLLTIPVALILIFDGGQLLRLWLHQVPAHATEVLLVLSINFIFQVPGHNLFSLMVGTERAGKLARFSTSVAMVNVTVSICAVSAIGVIGPAVGSLFTILLMDGFYVARIIRLELGVSILNFWRTIMGPFAITLLVSTGVGLLTLRTSGPVSYLLIPALPPITWVTWWLSGATAEQKKALKKLRR